MQNDKNENEELIEMEIKTLEIAGLKRIIEML